MKLPRKERDELSATLTQTLGLILAYSGLFALTALGSPPAWWASRGATHAVQVTTNDGVVTTNYITNDYAAVTQGQLKQFTARAVDELNADLTNGAGTNLNTMVSNWAQDYATNGYNATNLKPSDYTAITVSQLKYIGSNVWAQLVTGGYTNALPSWLDTNSADHQLANLGQLKTVFNFNWNGPPAAPSSLTVTPSNPGELDLTWTNNATDATSLTISESMDGGVSWTTIATLSDTTTDSYAVTELTAGDSYQFQVGANDSNNSTSSSSTASSSQQAPATPRYVVLDLGANFAPVGINYSGVVVGSGPTTNNPTGPAVPEVWGQGILSELSTNYAGWTNFSVVGIDDAGNVAGNMVYIGYTPDTVGNLGCYWADTNSATAPIPLGPTEDYGPEFPEGVVVDAISDEGFIVGFGPYGHATALQFNPTWTGMDGNYWTNYPAQLTIINDSNSGPRPLSVGGENWCGIDPYNSCGPIINGTAYTEYSDLSAIAINDSGVVVGTQDETNVVVMTHGSGSTLVTNTIGLGSPVALNNQTTPSPQIVGVDGSYNSTLWDYTSYDGTNTTAYVGKNLGLLISQTNGWIAPTPVAINNAGAIIGSAYYYGSNPNIANTTHGVMLLPCQLTLLNGSQTSTDADGMFFDGTRPTTVSALSNYTTPVFVSSTTNSQDGYDILGPLPFGNGATGDEGDVCIYSIAVVAKVMPSVANVTYGWARFVQDADVAITHTSTNTWYVNSISGIPVPPPTNNDTGSNAFYTVIPSTNSNIIAYSDGPGMNLLLWNDQCGLGDFAYHKDHFTYFLTNSVGSTNAVATLPVGQIIVCQRIHTDHTTPPVAADWTNVINIISTTNIPDCNAYTTNEIHQIVGPGDPIIFDHSVPVNP